MTSGYSIGKRHLFGIGVLVLLLLTAAEARHARGGCKVYYKSLPLVRHRLQIGGVLLIVFCVLRCPLEAYEVWPIKLIVGLYVEEGLVNLWI